MLGKLIRSFLLSVLLSFPLASAAEGEWIYTIKTDDNLWNNAEKHLVDVRYWLRLQKLNEVTDPTHMKPGSTIQIPLAWTRIRPATATVKAVTGAVTVYHSKTSEEKTLKRGMKLSSGDVVKPPKDADRKGVGEGKSELGRVARGR